MPTVDGHQIDSFLAAALVHQGQTPIPEHLEDVPPEGRLAYYLKAYIPRVATSLFDTLMDDAVESGHVPSADSEVWSMKKAQIAAVIAEALEDYYEDATASFA